MGVYAEALATTGRTYGVYGFEASPLANSAGVRGVDFSGLAVDNTVIFFPSAGVRGDGRSSIGVLGVSQNDGVVGSLVNSSNTILATGYLGDLRGAVAWAVFGAGNIGATGAKPFLEV